MTRAVFSVPIVSRSLDCLLLVPALLLVLIEHVLWAGSRATLRGIAGMSLVRAMHLWLALLPPYVALPLFLVPDLCSHAAGLWATVLLARGHIMTATVIAVVFKGVATLVLVWIYQACEPALLRVAWFAWLHRRIHAMRHWVFAKLRPLRDALLLRLSVSAARSGRLGQRFLAIRLFLAGALERAWPRA